MLTETKRQTVWTPYARVYHWANAGGYEAGGRAYCGFQPAYGWAPRGKAWAWDRPARLRVCCDCGAALSRMLNLEHGPSRPQPPAPRPQPR